MEQYNLTARDREIIASHTINGPEERYPEQPIYAFKGRHAFDLHSRLVRLVDEWDGLFTEAQKENCALLATIQTTISKATMKHSALPAERINPLRRIKLYFYSKEQMVPSGTSFSSTQGKQWLALLEAEPGNLL